MSQPVDTQLRAYFEQLEESHGPLTVTAILDRAAPNQELRDTRTALKRTVIRRWAWVIALILFVGLTIVLGSIGPEDTQPVDQITTTSVPSTLPTTAPPPPAETGALATSIGTADWWTVSGADGALPDSGGWLFEHSGGYEMVVGPGADPVEYWTSLDGRTWEQTSLPDGLVGLEGQSGVGLRQVGETQWLVTSTGAWTRGADGWRAIPLPAELARPWLSEVDDQVWLTSTAPVGIWRLDGETWTPFDPGVASQDLNDLASFLGGRTVGSSGVVVVPWDADTLTVIDPGGVATPMTPPWAAEIGAADGEQPDELTVFGNERGFVAVVVDWRPGTECPPTRPRCETFPDVNVVSSWTSSDGVAWEGPNQPGFLPVVDPFGTYVSLAPAGDLFFAGVQSSTGSSEMWISEDGLQWELSPVPYLGSLSFDPVGPAWVYFDSGTMYTSPDLRQWESVSTPSAATIGDGGGAIMWASSGNVFYVYTVLDGGDPTLWIAEFGG